jgi:hypothetical protein
MRFLFLASLFTVVACSSSSSDSGSTPTPTSDAGADAAIPVETDAGTTTDSGSGACSPEINGKLAAPSGTFQATITNDGSANLAKPSPGTIPCEATFDPNGGISLGGNQYTGAFNMQCWGTEGDLYFGMRLGTAAKPKAGDSFPVGHVTAVSNGGGYTSNGQSDLAWEEGPRCDTKMDKSKEWNGEASSGAGGAFVVDTVSGQDVTFHVTQTNLTLSNNGLNYKGTGTFKLAGTGTVKVTGM